MLHLENNGYAIHSGGIDYRLVHGVWHIIPEGGPAPADLQVSLTRWMAEDVYKQKLQDGSVFPDFWREMSLTK